LVHASGTRIRLRIDAEPLAQQRLHAALKAQPEIAQVRINSLACSCVIQFRDRQATPATDAALNAWLGQLPIAIDGTEASTAKPTAAQ
jgi:hypothetical protein